MKRAMMLSVMFVLSLGLVGGSVLADDDKKPEMKKDDKKPDAKKDGDDKKDDKKSEEPEKKPKAPEPKLADFSAYANGEPQSGEVLKCDENSVTIRQVHRVKEGRGFKNVNHDMEFKYAEGALVRKEKAPEFFNEKGLERPATASELERLKKPAGAPGYALERSELKPADLVKLTLVRPRAISATKAKPEDYMIKFALVVGEATKPATPPKK